MGKIFGCELILGAFSRVLPWIFIWNILLFRPKNSAAKSSLYLNLAIFEFFFSKGRLFGGLSGKDSDRAMESSRGLGLLFGYIVFALFWRRERRGVFGLLGFGAFSLLPAPTLLFFFVAPWGLLTDWTAGRS